MADSVETDQVGSTSDCLVIVCKFRGGLSCPLRFWLVEVLAAVPGLLLRSSPLPQLKYLGDTRPHFTDTN